MHGAWLVDVCVGEASASCSCFGGSSSSSGSTAASGAVTSGEGEELIVANSIWVKGVRINNEYVTSMSKLFKV